MNTIRRVIIIVFCTGFMLACTSSRTKTDYRTDYDFSRLQSFAILPVDESIYKNPKVSQIEVDRVGALISRELQKRYKNVEKHQADFHIRYFIVVEERMKVDTYNASFGMYRYGYGYSYGLHSPQTSNSYYQQGSIIVDIIDAKTEDVIWRGSTEGRVKNSRTPQQREARVAGYLMELFSLFPPKLKQ
ncbi:protein of unknown function [Alteromonadaceae bacterium Bs31]|nr:protein of unknown function [Alteromonadaceae bacterium Bs31]